MQLRPFQLTPFPGEAAPTGIAVAGELSRRRDLLSIRYRLSGPLERLRIPTTAANPQRRDQLWKGLCFELFLAPGDDRRYWEFNLSPSGHWNLYRFDDYRAGMQPEPAWSELPFDLRLHPSLLELELELMLNRAGLDHDLPGSALNIGISAVVADSAGHISHWALAHPGPRPDFHRRDSFSLHLR